MCRLRQGIFGTEEAAMKGRPMLTVEFIFFGFGYRLVINTPEFEFNGILLAGFGVHWKGKLTRSWALRWLHHGANDCALDYRYFKNNKTTGYRLRGPIERF